MSKKEKTLSAAGGCSPQTPYGFLSTFEGKEKRTNPDDCEILTSKGWRFVDRKDVLKSVETIDLYKPMISKLTCEHAGTPDKMGMYRVLSRTEMLKPSQICSQSYLTICPQDTEETILSWFSEDDMSSFLGKHQTESFDLSTFPKEIIKILNWFIDNVSNKYLNKIYKPSDCYSLYKRYGFKKFDVDLLKYKCADYYANSEITNKKGILEYSLQETNKENANEQLLCLRLFPSEWKALFAKDQEYKCAKCGKSLKDEVEYTKSELDHIVSWKKGGLTEKSNCQLLCQSCNRTKSGK